MAPELCKTEKKNPILNLHWRKDEFKFLWNILIEKYFDIEKIFKLFLIFLAFLKIHSKKEKERKGFHHYLFIPY